MLNNYTVNRFNIVDVILFAAFSCTAGYLFGRRVR